MSYDYLIVGAGLYGAVFAQQAREAGRRVLVIDKREVVGGNCRTEKREGIDVHLHGPHIFHTKSEKVWSYVNRFTRFNHFVNRPKVHYKGRLLSFPINLFTLYQMWGTQTPAEAEARLQQERIPCENPRNLEDWILSQVGREIYETFIKGYTTKQWKMDPKELPSFIIRRLPIRLTFDDNYFTDPYQGIPVDGYTALIERLFEGIEIRTGVDYLENRGELDGLADRVVYTGRIDEFFEQRFGELPYRTLSFQHDVYEQSDHQGNAIINYTEVDIPYTRRVEHKHFAMMGETKSTVVTTETPGEWTKGATPYYPINTPENDQRYKQYRELVDTERYLIGGRLGEYRYYDMDQTIASALAAWQREIENPAVAPRSVRPRV
ncbi:MAG: UDP-galactopyranose mutase [Planctomycetota bacterium]